MKGGGVFSHELVVDAQPAAAAAVARLHGEAPLTDIHAHPSLKAYLFRRNLWRHYVSGRTFNPFSSRSDFAVLERGGVGVLWAAHYLPERELFEQCFWLRATAALLLPVYRKLTAGSLLQRLLEMMDRLEREVARRPERTELARSPADLARIRDAGRLAVIHTVEGAHALEGDPANLDRLAERGVAMLTLSHFFDNGVAAQVDGIPPEFLVKKVCRLDQKWRRPQPLTDLGRAILRRTGELGILVDLAHLTPAARAAVFAESDLGRTLVASHVGVARWNPDPYNLEDHEIRELARRGGIVGVIFMTYWLDARHPDRGLDAIWRTIEQVQAVTGSFDHLALGTDFDGFTDPPDDVTDASHLPAVTAMLLARGVPEADVLKILGGNARRVLEASWRGRRRAPD